MQTKEVATLSFGTRRGYLVLSGEPLGKDDLQREVLEDDDVVIDEVTPAERGWLIQYHAVHVRPR